MILHLRQLLKHCSVKLKQKLTSQPNILPPEEHQIYQQNISPNALKVVALLQQANYEAYLVGGCVRDLLLNNKPKDFDVATNAKPEEVKRIFRNCRLIGRRFRLAHVRIGRETIEVATFRAGHDSIPKEKNNKFAQSGSINDQGLITRDNIYGSILDDALRRDFTINAFYYNPKDNSVRDYSSSMEDLQAKQLRLIGDPYTRYREDPVRMLRAIRFAAKLNFELTPDTAEPISELAPLLKHVAAARLFDETVKAFLCGQAKQCLNLLLQYNLFEYLFPTTLKLMQHNPLVLPFLNQTMTNTDARLERNKPVTPAFLYAAMLWFPLQFNLKEKLKQNKPFFPTLHQTISFTLEKQQTISAIPKRFTQPIREIWELQFRLPQRFGKRAEQIRLHTRFRAAYDFLLLREEVTDSPPGLGDWWTKYQFADAETRQSMLRDLTAKNP